MDDKLFEELKKRKNCLMNFAELLDLTDEQCKELEKIKHSTS